MEKQFRFVTDKVKLWDVSVGRSLLLLLFMGLPGKLIPWTIRYIIAHSLDSTAPDYFKKVDTLTRVLGAVAGFFGAVGVKKLKGVLGETGAEALSLGTLTGALDAIGNGVGNYNRDISDILSHGTREKLLDLISKVKGTSVAGPGNVGAAEGSQKTELAGFPEAGTSAWREQQKWLAGPGEKPQETAGPPPREEFGVPEAPVDPVQRIEEVLVAKSKQ